MESKTKFKETQQRLEAIISKQEETLRKLRMDNDHESLMIKNQCIYHLTIQNWRLGFLEALNIWERGEGLEHFINNINLKMDEEQRAFEERRAVI